MRKLTLLIVILIGFKSLFAQDCNEILTGKVINITNGSPLKGAIITFNNRKIITDSKGSFLINNLCPIRYAFKIEHENFETQIFTHSQDKEATREFFLEHPSVILDDVKIIASNKKIDKITNSLTENWLDRKLLEEYSNQTLGDALKEITGINGLTSGFTNVKPVIQGLHSSRIIMMNNGVRQEDQEWGDEHSPNMDINAFNTIKVIKGSGALQYGGNAIGGVVVAQNLLTTLKDTIFGKTQFTANTNGRGGGTNANLNIGFGDGWSAKLQGTLKHFGDSEAPDYVLSNTGHDEQSFSGGIGFSKFSYGFEGYYSFYNATQGILKASHIGNFSDLIRAINAEAPLIINDFTYDIESPKQETQHHLMKLKFYKRFSNIGKLNIQYSFQHNNRKEYDINKGKEQDAASLDLKLVTHAIESSFNFDANNDFKKRIGVQLTYQKNTPNPETGIRRLIPDYVKSSIGAFAITEFTINDLMTADAGIRYDFVNIDAKKFYKKNFWDNRGYGSNYSDIILKEYDNQLLANPVLEYRSVSASGGLNFSFTNTNTLLLAFSLANRAPNPVELFSDGLHHNAAIIEEGDLRFKQERAYKFTVSSVQTNFLNSMRLAISPYVSMINDFILLEPTGVDYTIRGAFPIWEYKQTNALLYGLDIDFEIEIIKDLKFNTGFAYVYGQDTTNDIPLISMPAPNLRSTLAYQKEKWNLKLANTTSFKQARFPNNNFKTDYIENSKLTTTIVDISSPPNGYSVFDLSGSYNFSFWNPKDFTVGLNIVNVLNTKYRDYLNRQRFYADNLGRNFIINLNLKF